ncbi:TetR/AcrR family transcriptional regulator [Eisenibacter elegans]|jgi:AcrR family transcriptional regulator|uniref:TetR/AcrR family transcriptional regulator n=1 Tax=Eisenibacter elegans TaxID=997 RepID=UPI0003F83135|nr:TetR/AcrR family transcriptional regulator [Eisenibacter elegans]
MGVSERKEREKLERRNAIVDAAERVFFSQGLERASMEQIAQEAELSKGTLYLYFKNKEDLFKAVVLRGFIALRRKLKEAALPQDSGLENVKAISQAYISFANEHLGYFNAILLYQNDMFDSGDLNGVSIKSLEGGNAVIGVLIHAIEKGIDDRSILPHIQPVETAFVLWSQITGLLQVIQRKMRIISFHYRIKSDDLLNHYFELLIRSLTNPATETLH